ncbi:tRNA pseudouridine(55) synthase TruB [Paracoccus sp. p4-l81]|uniref:tRNA pseudouridine(55) synthase TruB n=1 Tax=unclassified Paracoccus (in: a-proteobacteria) TaxID=2688777 RepID=UPI0035B9002B
MARRKKGRAISGWVVVDKPAGIGSTTVVSAVRRAFDATKAGHAGTLDPDATGILAVALGEATKTVAVLTDALKAYDFQVRWGAETTSDDASGAVTVTSDLRPDAGQIIAALPGFCGLIQQVPPQVSAVKVDGERAYDLAREGVAMDLAPRDLWVGELTLIDTPDVDTAVLRLVCGKGGYVRAIARDLGRKLGCLGHVVTLRRIWSGPFDLADAVPFAQIDGALAGSLDDRILPLEAALTDLPEVRLPPESAIRVRNGNPAPGIPVQALDWGAACWASAAGRPVGLGRWQGGDFAPDRLFQLPD